MTNDAVQQCIWDCRKAKIELEHEVLLREMDVALAGLAGTPIAVVALLIQYSNSPVVVLGLLLILAIGLGSFYYLSEDRKEKILKKQQEIDALVTEMNAYNS
jgi:hypothetical protein